MRKGKKALLAIITGILSVTLISCGNEKPKNVLENTFTEIQENNDDYNNKFIELGMQKESLGQTTDFLDEECKGLIDQAFSKLQFKITSEKVEDDTATFNVTVVGPNISLVLSNTALKRTMTIKNMSVNEDGTEAVVDMSDNNLNDIIRNALIESFENSSTDDRTGTITLSKVDGKWQIDENDQYVQLVLGKSN